MMGKEGSLLSKVGIFQHISREMGVFRYLNTLKIKKQYGFVIENIRTGSTKIFHKCKVRKI